MAKDNPKKTEGIVIGNIDKLRSINDSDNIGADECISIKISS